MEGRSGSTDAPNAAPPVRFVHPRTRPGSPPPPVATAGPDRLGTEGGTYVSGIVRRRETERCGARQTLSRRPPDVVVAVRAPAVFVCEALPGDAVTTGRVDPTRGLGTCQIASPGLGWVADAAEPR